MNPAPMQPGGTIVGRIIAALIMVVFGVALLAVLVPVGVFVLALAAILIVAAMVRGWFKRASAPNGVFDGRRNVRVVERNDDVLEP